MVNLNEARLLLFRTTQVKSISANSHFLAGCNIDDKALTILQENPDIFLSDPRKRKIVNQYCPEPVMPSDMSFLRTKQKGDGTYPQFIVAYFGGKLCIRTEYYINKGMNVWVPYAALVQPGELEDLLQKMVDVGVTFYPV